MIQGERGSDLRPVRKRQDRHSWPLLRNSPGRAARVGEYRDCFRAKVDGDRCGCPAMAVPRHRSLVPIRPLGPHRAAPARVAFNGPRDLRHGLHRLDWPVTDRRFAGEHNGIGPIEDRVRDVACFGAGRTWVLDHRLQHLGRGDHRLAMCVRQADESLLDDRYLVGLSSTPRSPRATIRPSLSRTIASRFRTACGFSILATRGCWPPSSRILAWHRHILGGRTKLSATISTPSSTPNARSERSFGVIAGWLTWVPGQVESLLGFQVAAMNDDRVAMSPQAVSRSTDCTRSSISPSSMRIGPRS